MHFDLTDLLVGFGVLMTVTFAVSLAGALRENFQTKTEKIVHPKFPSPAPWTYRLLHVGKK